MHFSLHLRQAIAAFALAALGPLAGARAQAQAAPFATNYAGPRFPGGPDSLRALLGRVQRQASPALHGEIFVLLELNKAGQPAKSSYLRPATKADLALARTKEVQELTQKLLGQLPPWQLTPSILPADNRETPKVVLPLTFGPTTAPTPLLYSDEKPVFPLPVDARAPLTTPAYLPFLQSRFRYPAEDLRGRVQGTVYAYFEVSETGAVEQRRIVGSLSPTIDAELLRVLAALPNATTPPRQQGQPVRVAYVVPIELRII